MDNETVNVYDFDDTIYDGDSTVDFYLYCLVRHPAMMLRWPQTFYNAVLYALKIIDKTAFKEKIFRFLRHVPDVHSDLDAFWESHMDRIKDWYLEQKRPTDIVSTASPFFMVAPACEELGIKCIGSPVDPKSGLYSGRNNKSGEKVNSLKKEFPNVEINEFYSDSLTDAPLAMLADMAYLVDGDDIKPWPRAK